MSRPEVIALLKRLFDTLENTPVDSPQYEEAHRELDYLLFGEPIKHDAIEEQEKATESAKNSVLD